MGGKPIESNFEANFDRTFEACRQAVAELGYSILEISKESSTISFNTGRSMKSWGGQDLSANLFASGDSMRVVVSGSLAKGGTALTGGGAQLGAWGEKKALSRKFLETVSTILPSIPEPKAQTNENNASNVADELLKLKELLDMEAISQEEFDTQKTKLLN